MFCRLIDYLIMHLSFLKIVEMFAKKLISIVLVMY
jgi:hypothetical protein